MSRSTVFGRSTRAISIASWPLFAVAPRNPWCASSFDISAAIELRPAARLPNQRPNWPPRQIDNAGEMNGFLKARAPLFRNALDFGDGAMRLKADYAPQLDSDSLEAYLLDSLTCGAGVAAAPAA